LIPLDFEKDGWLVLLFRYWPAIIVAVAMLVGGIAS
jgi:hypothetical protein